MQLTKAEIMQELAKKGIKANANATKAQLNEMLMFYTREEVQPTVADDVVVAPNGIKFSTKTAKLAGLI